jgi:hypothetical protein
MNVVLLGSDCRRVRQPARLPGPRTLKEPDTSKAGPNRCA